MGTVIASIALSTDSSASETRLKVKNAKWISTGDSAA